MTGKDKETERPGSSGIPQRDRSGVPEPSQEVSQNDPAVPGTAKTGPADEELAWARKHVPGPGTVGRKTGVFRKTELRGIAPPSTPEEIKKARQRTMKTLKDPGGVIAYRPFEDAFREFICSLMEQQDRVYDEMLLHVADLQQQVDVLERRIAEARASPGSAEAKG